MKDYSQEEYEASRPDISGIDAIDFCLGRLYKDRKHVSRDAICDELTFEELIGALLVARDAISAQVPFVENEAPDADDDE